jgi:hypothetical protein
VRFGAQHAVRQIPVAQFVVAVDRIHLHTRRGAFDDRLHRARYDRERIGRVLEIEAVASERVAFPLQCFKARCHFAHRIVPTLAVAVFLSRGEAFLVARQQGRCIARAARAGMRDRS